MLLIIGILATWRLTHLITSEDGPGDIIVSLRLKLGNGFWASLMDCFFCASLWISAFIAILIAQELSEFILNWLALSGGACLIYIITEKKEGII